MKIKSPPQQKPDSRRNHDWKIPTPFGDVSSNRKPDSTGNRTLRLLGTDKAVSYLVGYAVNNCCSVPGELRESAEYKIGGLQYRSNDADTLFDVALIKNAVHKADGSLEKLQLRPLVDLYTRLHWPEPSAMIQQCYLPILYSLTDIGAVAAVTIDTVTNKCLAKTAKNNTNSELLVPIIALSMFDWMFHYGIAISSETLSQMYEISDLGCQRRFQERLDATKRAANPLLSHGLTSKELLRSLAQGWTHHKRTAPLITPWSTWS